ncbi:diacylglycerol/lipid kinase family protein [Streptomyces sp. NPDC051366]|uniref:diacylglycerol/lipid kinase family protein n=1 Tax=Streptomyces sp. NPDC051366 TaxID=3365652 RepID=UPI00379F9DBE
MNRRWTARLALATGLAALVVLVVFGGLASLLLMVVGWAGLVLTAAGVWWMLTHTGWIRVLAALLVVVAPLAVLLLYSAAGLLWVVLVSLALWALAVAAGSAALAEDASSMPERSAVRAERPFLIMNPRSGGGKVEKFRLAERARALGAEVVVLDPARRQDVAELARQAVEGGADLLGAAGGDGTQALVAAVAVEHDIPFMVISAGTRNHFAMDLGLDRQDPSRCLEALTDGVELRVDLGYIHEGEPADENTGRVFVNSASFGVYAEVVQSPAYRDDKARTILEMLPALLTQDSGSRLTVRADALVLDGPQAVLVSNNPYQKGDSAGLGRRERLDSGELGVLGVEVSNAAEAAGLLLHGRQGGGLTAVTAREVVVDADAPAIPVGVDGEALVLSTPVRCRIASGALRVRVPRHRPGVPRTAPPMDWRRVRRLALTMGRTAAGRGAA